MAKRKFSPKSKILGRYFKEVPFGLKEISKKLDKPLYEKSNETQYAMVVILKLINKRQENLDKFLDMPPISFRYMLASFSDLEFKKFIPMINGASDFKRNILIDFLINGRLRSSEKDIIFIIEDILKSKEKDMKNYEQGYYPTKTHLSLFYHKFDKQIYPVRGQKKNITYYTLRKNDKRSLFLDDYSDCCQGLGKAGEKCMINGIKFGNEGFLVFERRGVIFAQGWIRKIDNDLLIDSIEFKGEFNDSLVEALKASIKDLGKHYKNIYLGLSPNRYEITKALKNYDIYHRGNKNVSHIFEYVHSNKAYSDAKEKIIKMK